MQKISFHSADKTFYFPAKKSLKRFLVTLFNNENIELDSLQYIFCSDEYLLKINKDFLQHDYYTDIITFELSELSGVVNGEIYISLDRVKDNSIQIGTNYQFELLRVIFHGALHLCGYKDKKKSEILLMREKEDQYLSLFGKHSNI